MLDDDGPEKCHENKKGYVYRIGSGRFPKDQPIKLKWNIAVRRTLSRGQKNKKHTPITDAKTGENNDSDTKVIRTNAVKTIGIIANAIDYILISLL